MYRQNNGLFSSFRLGEYISSKLASADSEAKHLDAEVFEANDDQQIIDHIVSKHMLYMLELREDEKETEFAETKVDARNYGNRVFFDEYDDGPVSISGYRVSWKIPIGGTIELFNSQPSSFIMTSFPGEILSNSKLLLTTELPADSADEESISNNLNGILGNIRTMANNVNNDLSNYENSLKTKVSEAVEGRKRELEKIIKLKSALRVNVEPRKSVSPLNQIGVKLHTISALSTKMEEPGAYIDQGSYESILKAIRNMGASMEATRASEGKDEEALRDILLVGLNASMSAGSAGGELFRKKGKTDISILFENKAAFIAECKLWKGEKYIQDGITQMLGYLTWRDAKTAVVIFNKENKNFSGIQSQISDVFLTHKLCAKKDKVADGEWRFQFKKPDDENRLITIHVFLFDVCNIKDNK